MHPHAQFRPWPSPLRLWWIATLAVLCSCSHSEPLPAPVQPATTPTIMSSPSSPTPQTAIPSATTETAVIAGGCFWGVEELLRALPGVVGTDVGYTGGQVAAPTYGDVKTGRSGHAEAVRIVFDPKRISYADLLLYFFKIHDPTTKNRQGNDVGTQYRSAIFYQSPEQQQVAQQVIARVNESGAWKAPVATEVVAGSEFTPAEDYHQDYLQKHPNGYTCHFERDVSYD